MNRPDSLMNFNALNVLCILSQFKLLLIYSKANWASSAKSFKLLSELLLLSTLCFEIFYKSSYFLVWSTVNELIVAFDEFLKATITLQDLGCANGPIQAVDLLIASPFHIFIQMISDVIAILEVVKETIQIPTKVVSLCDLFACIAMAGEVMSMLTGFPANIEFTPTIKMSLTE